MGRFGARDWRRAGATALVGVILAAGGCTSSKSPDVARPSGSPSAGATNSPSTLPLQVGVTPADAATEVPTSTDLTVAAEGATVAEVVLTDAKGIAVPGALGVDGRTWRPARQLAYATRYTARAVARAGDRAGTATTSFTTMAAPSAVNGASLYVSDGDVVGVGMPVVVEFVRKVPDGTRAAIERRLSVTSTPAVQGTWHWFSAKEVHWRPREHWQPGTKVSVRLGIGGLPMGSGTYGRRDRTASFTIGSRVESRIDNATKTMTVIHDGVVVRRMPVSLGRDNYPSSSGTHVVMDKAYTAMFDSSTYGLPVDSPDGYRTKVFYVARYTWGGEFVHAAPWSVDSQGRRNVSHGCVNVSNPDGQWFFETAKRGDLVTITGTGRQVAKGNGWTDWNMTWEQYRQGSALA